MTGEDVKRQVTATPSRWTPAPGEGDDLLDRDELGMEC